MPRINNARTQKSKATTARNSLAGMLWPSVRISSLLVVVGLSLYVYGSTDISTVYSDYRRKVTTTISNALQLKISQIKVTGAHFTSKITISRALGFSVNDSMLQVNLEKAHQNLQKLEWLKSVRITRAFPNTISVHLTERSPLALWQHHKKLTLIDSDGRQINIPNIKSFYHLPHILGEGAPASAKKFLTQLKSHPGIMKNLVACAFIDKRRWNLIVKKKVRIKLPEENLSEALMHLEKLLKDGYISDDSVLSVDLRIPNRTYFQLTPKAYLAQTKRTGSYT